MRKKRNFFKLIMACLFTLGTPIVTGCDSSESFLDIDSFDYGFIKDTGGDIDYNSKKERMILDVGQKYFFVYNFTVSPSNDNDGNLTFSAEITFNEMDIYEGHVEESSGDTKSLTFSDPDTGFKTNTAQSTFKIPRKANEVKNIRILVSLTPVRKGEANISLTFSTDFDIILSGSNPEGLNKTIEVQSVKIKSPVLSYNDLDLILTWDHVANADFYVFYKDGYPLEYRYNVDEYLAVGDPIFVPIDGELNVSESCMIKIQAYNESASYIPSQFSNEVMIRL